jgi:8-oxo-dGTP pyrophosphatase MutT (NUDIX family)
MPQAHEPSHWEVVSEKQIADCKIFNIYEERCRHPIDGREGDFYSIASRDWVNTVAITPAREIILVRQYRFAVRELSWEIPGGIIDPGESPLEAGLRELQEETGYVGENARLLAHCSPNPAILRNRCYFAYVENVRLIAKLNLDPNEEIEVCAVPVDEALEWALDFRICHTLTINALFYLQKLKGN